MGSNNVADALTGLSIGWDEPVVAVLVDRRRFGWPDPRKGSAMSAFRATSLFEPVALPVRGTYGGYGKVVPDGDQPAVALACAMTGHPDWASFSRAAFDDKAGVRYQGHGPVAKVLGDAEHDDPVPLGHAFFRPESWERLLSLGRGKLSREADVASVLSAMADIRDRAAAGDDAAAMLHSPVLDLSARHDYVSSDGTSARLPPLACALDYFEGGSEVSRGFASWLTGTGRRLGFALLEGDTLDGARPILDGLHDLQAMSAGLRKLGRVLLPSPSTSQDINHRAVADMALAGVSDTADRLVALFQEEPQDHLLDELEALARKVESLRDGIVARLEAAAEAPSP